jgi:long-chain fatty acid transport protein
MTLKLLFTASALAITLAAAPQARADSFALNENSALELGRANAGAAAHTDDASIAFGNPAAMALFTQPTFTAALSGVFGADERFRDEGSRSLTGAPLGPGADDFLETGIIPALHMVIPINQRWAAGFSVTAPFGLATTYDDGWAGRYQAIKSELTTINFNPSISYRVNDTLSLGLGVSAQYADATLSNAIDFGAVCFGALAPTTCTTIGLTPQSADGVVQVEGDDWGVGYNLGLAWTPRPDLLFGFSYRSEISHDLRGSADFGVPTQALPLTASGAFADTPASASIDLPAAMDATMRWQASEQTTLYINFRYRFWSSLEELRVQFANPAQPDSVEELRYEDAFRLAFGIDYVINDKWSVRGGYAYDQTPTQDEFRSARISDDNRHYFALGASYMGWAGWQVDMAYNRVEIIDHDFDHTGRFGDHLLGEYTGAADVISIGLTRRLAH